MNKDKQTLLQNTTYFALTEFKKNLRNKAISFFASKVMSSL